MWGKHCFASKNIVSDACKGDVRKYSQRGCGLSDTFMLGRVTRIASAGGSVYNIRWEARKWRYQSTKEHTSMHYKTEWSEAPSKGQKGLHWQQPVDCCFAAVYHLGFADACVRTRGNGSN